MPGILEELEATTAIITPEAQPEVTLDRVIKAGAIMVEAALHPLATVRQAIEDLGRIGTVS
jgi:hypothetical protein